MGLTLNVKEKDHIDCKGLVFRGIKNSFWSKGRLVSHTEIRLLKRKSCGGCDKCCWIEGHIAEICCDDGNIQGLNEVVNGKLYAFKFTDTSSHTDCGYEYDMDTEIIEIQERDVL